jgi:hypothetical protein
MFTTVLFANEKQIIVGSFVQDNYASNALVRLNTRILNDEKLSKLVDKNMLKTQIKKMGPYNAVSISTFTSYVQLLRTLKALEKYYDDAYVLDDGVKLEIDEVIVKKEIEDKILAPLKEEVKTQEAKEPEVVEKVVKKVVAEEKIQTPLKETKVKKVEISEDFTLEIVLVLLLLIGGAYIVYRRSRQKKDEQDQNAIEEE